MVSKVDFAAERVIIETITRERPNDAILAEEGGARKGNSAMRWVIDPLDGTVNHLYRYPGFTVSIGLEVDGRKCLCVLHDSYHNQVYTSIVDRLAQCDGKPNGLVLARSYFTYKLITRCHSFAHVLYAARFRSYADPNIYHQMIIFYLERTKFVMHRFVAPGFSGFTVHDYSATLDPNIFTIQIRINHDTIVIGLAGEILIAL